MFQCIVFVMIQYDCKFWHSFVHRDNFVQFLFELFWRILDTKSFHLISCTIISGITWSVNKHDGQRAHNTSCFGIDRRYVTSKYFAWYYTSKWWYKRNIIFVVSRSTKILPLQRLHPTFKPLAFTPISSNKK